MKVGGLRLARVHVLVALLTLALISTMTIQSFAEEVEGTKALAKAIGAALAVGLAGLGAGFAIGTAGAAVASGIVERREVLGPLLLVVVLGEGIAIYGLLIALLVILLI